MWSNWSRNCLSSCFYWQRQNASRVSGGSAPQSTQEEKVGRVKAAERAREQGERGRATLRQAASHWQEADHCKENVQPMATWSHTPGQSWSHVIFFFTQKSLFSSGNKSALWFWPCSFVRPAFSAHVVTTVSSWKKLHTSVKCKIYFCQY